MHAENGIKNNDRKTEFLVRFRVDGLVLTTKIDAKDEVEAKQRVESRSNNIKILSVEQNML